jgi:hypothetical protein
MVDHVAVSEILPTAQASRPPAGCPMCGGPNDCRMESGEGFKGRCWCERVAVSAEALERLGAKMLAPRCLCRGCLEKL